MNHAWFWYIVPYMVYINPNAKSKQALMWNPIGSQNWSISPPPPSMVRPTLGFHQANTFQTWSHEDLEPCIKKVTCHLYGKFKPCFMLVIGWQFRKYSSPLLCLGFSSHNTTHIMCEVNLANKSQVFTFSTNHTHTTNFTSIFPLFPSIPTNQL